MSYPMVYYFATFVVISTHSMIILVKGQCTVQGCENGDSSNSIVAEIQQLITEAIRQQQNEQVQSIHHLLNASLQQMKNKQDTIVTSLQVIDRRSKEQDIYIKQVQSIYELLNASFQEMKDQHAVAMRRLNLVIQLLLYPNISIENQTQNTWNLTIGLPVQPEVDFGDGPVLLPIVNNWIILMHRFDGSLNFNRNWTEYRNGFGEIGRGEFWLGNEKVHRLTNRIGSVYTLRIEIQLNETSRWYYANYATFSLDSEDNKYTLRLSGYSGNAGDSLTNTSVGLDFYLGGMNFTTSDDDNDRHPVSCAQKYEGGWWFNRCFTSCLTCPYDKTVFKWTSEKGWQTIGILRAARMMIRSI